MNKWIVRLIVAVASIFVVNLLGRWYMDTPAYQRDAAFDVLGRSVWAACVCVIALAVAIGIVLFIQSLRAKPLDPETRSKIHEATKQPRGGKL